ncbi:phosphatidylinositol:udp-c transferase pig-c [Diplodia corticola]|uniref:Phosphatidylinositol:udp-c transferase pig-c n=1 Tax=Diplodia corticola TaxID=236234 RepID=A0A1J9RB33_9PEZI|nr:phosphatidylinositol:udp-c transferase pig-c [Diplodia corticola]OJD37354.1 phosphatidylinositol:udp-c transferase pig-c [Diplodia corticola]
MKAYRWKLGSLNRPSDAVPQQGQGHLLTSRRSKQRWPGHPPTMHQTQGTSSFAGDNASALPCATSLSLHQMPTTTPSSLANDDDEDRRASRASRVSSLSTPRVSPPTTAIANGEDVSPTSAPPPPRQQQSLATATATAASKPASNNNKPHHKSPPSRSHRSHQSDDHHDHHHSFPPAAAGIPDPSRLAPEDAIFPPPPRISPQAAASRRALVRSFEGEAEAEQHQQRQRQQLAVTGGSGGLGAANNNSSNNNAGGGTGTGTATTTTGGVGGRGSGGNAVGGSGGGGSESSSAAGRIMEQRRKRERDRGRSGSRRRKGAWKKLLWVKQSYPDNYTDEETFLDHLQRNPRLQPYEFWPLVGDSTVIVQHVMSVAIWCSCFSGIVQARVTPFMVVCTGSALTVLGWLLWDFWVSEEEDAERTADAVAHVITAAEAAKNEGAPAEEVASSASSASSAAAAGQGSSGLGLLIPNANAPGARTGHSRGGSLASVVSNGSAVSAISTGHPTGDPTFAAAYQSPHGEPMSPRNQRRWATIKSAVLIYCVLLGLSPILKSLTKSTTSDSIWAMTSFLTIINISFFDYGGGVGAK